MIAVVNPAAGLIAALHAFTEQVLTVGPLILAVGFGGLVVILLGYAVVRS